MVMAQYNRADVGRPGHVWDGNAVTGFYVTITDNDGAAMCAVT